MILMVNNYKKINESFKRKVVYRIGLDAGFFSEYNNMILSVAWCLRNNFQFQLFSCDANFAYNKGWSDYFEPFCIEVNNEFHLKYNHRPYPYGSNRYYPPHVRAMQKYGYRKSNIEYLPILHRIGKKLGLGELLTQDIFIKAREQNLDENLEMPKIGFNGKLRTLCSLLTNLTWKFNDETQAEINKIINEWSISDKYIGFHIRCGDKSVEYQQVPLNAYIQKAETISEVRKAFVLTDDYSTIIKLKTGYPSWQFYTLCQPNENGYYNNEFQRLNAIEKRNRYIRFFSSMVLLEKSCHFVGTFSSNPGMFLGMRMLPETCHGVDFNYWRIW